MSTDLRPYIPDIWNLIEDSISVLIRDYNITLHFQDLLGLSVIHAESERILSPYLYHNNPFCNKVKSDPRKLKQCIQQKKKVLDYAHNNTLPFHGHCYMGYEEYIFPIQSDKTLVGVLFIGCLEKVKGLEPVFFRSVYMLIHLLTLSYDSYLRTSASSDNKILDAAALKNNHIISSTIKFIDDNLSAPLNLDTLAHNVYVNPTYLSSIFKHHVGTGIANYIQKKRLQLSLYQLIHSSRSITDIASEVGIADPAYFSRLFSQIYGMSPSAYRKSHRSVQEDIPMD